MLEFFYFGCITMSFGSALFCLCQTTVVSTFGAAMALSGDSAASVKYAAGHMKLQQDFVFMIGFVCIVSFFTAAVSLSWARRPTGQAVLNTIIYLSALTLLVVKGYKVYQSVNNLGGIDTEDGEDDKKEKKKDKRENYSTVKSSDSEVGSVLHNREGSVLNKESQEIDDTCTINFEAGKNLKAMGQLWFRDSIDLGGQLHERFGVIQKGVLEIYRNQRDFEKGKAPINEMPFQLKKYSLELDTKKVRRGLTSGKKSFRRLVSGQGEISLPVYVASEFDLKTAVKRFQFMIYPKVVSEVRPLPIGEFMANDEQSYKHWTRAIQTVIDATSESFHQNRAVNKAMR